MALDHAGLLVEVGVKKRIELPSDESSTDEPPPPIAPKVDTPGTYV